MIYRQLYYFTYLSSKQKIIVKVEKVGSEAVDFVYMDFNCGGVESWQMVALLKYFGMFYLKNIR